jgi:2-polyprenyl-6-hydroxyphenyl methylase/3-demethylubiquinone-9 3-methyltransferase
MHNTNIEVDKFNNLANHWWDKSGELKTLHHINAPRFNFIKNHVELKNMQVVDVGCGGGILCEDLAKSGAITTGIDLAETSIEVAKLHMLKNNLTIDYRCIAIDEFAQLNANKFDVLTCMELLEHVPNVADTIKHCSTMLKNNGMAFFSTINRNLLSYLGSIVMAEYILKIIPINTHNYAQFIKPSELYSYLLNNQLHITDINGISYNPFTTNAKLTNNVNINYLLACRKQ